MNQEFDLLAAASSLMLALGLSFGISALYTATYQGVGYLKGFAQTLALAGLASAAVMLCVGDSIARGIGIFGAVNLVQVRSTIKDTRDLMFVFITLAAGVACGVGAWGIALVATGLFAIAILFQSLTDFGARRGVSAVLRVKVNAAALMALPGVLARHTTRAVLSSSRSLGDEGAEQTYQLRLSGTTAQAALLADLPGAGVSESSMLLQDDSLEV
ncbi:MAG: hypothetical protein Q8L48_38590 [Archangium sp.]|nr:hypothetical protein [Archangium sp.]